MAKVLVVDDEDGIRRTTALFLEAAGHAVLTAGSVAEAAGLVSGESFDVILTDIIMPGDDGISLLRHAKRVSPLTHVVLFTGEPTLETATEALRLGAFDYLPKPVRKDEVCHVVSRASEDKSAKEKHAALNLQNAFHAVEQERLVESRTAELKDALARISKAFDGITTALSTALEMRDPYTAGHQRRVSELACAIWDRLGMDANAREGLRIAALLHDLGKISIPADILNKAGPLSPLEMKIVRTHPVSAWEILKPVEFPWPVATIVRQHHERIDGSGYPDNIDGQTMLPESQILAVADVVEAMLSPRPHRPAPGLKAAIAEIVSGQGILYRSDAVDACVSLFENDGFAFSG